MAYAEETCVLVSRADRAVEHAPNRVQRQEDQGLFAIGLGSVGGQRPAEVLMFLQALFLSVSGASDLACDTSTLSEL